VALAELVGQVGLAARVVRAALAGLVGQEALAGLVVRVAEPEPSRAERLEHVPVVAALEHVPVEVELQLGHRRDRRGVPVGTKSVIAAHPPGLLHRAVEDSAAAVVETTHEPAAAEAAAAWEAAG
jgi:hypothetical protein